MAESFAEVSRTKSSLTDRYPQQQRSPPGSFDVWASIAGVHICPRCPIPVRLTGIELCAMLFGPGECRAFCRSRQGTVFPGNVDSPPAIDGGGIVNALSHYIHIRLRHMNDPLLTTVAPLAKRPLEGSPAEVVSCQRPRSGRPRTRPATPTGCTLTTQNADSRTGQAPLPIDLLTVEALAALLQISRMGIYRLVERRALPV